MYELIKLQLRKIQEYELIYDNLLCTNYSGVRSNSLVIFVFCCRLLTFFFLKSFRNTLRMAFDRFATVISRTAASKEWVKMRNRGIDQSVKRSPDTSTLRYHGLVCDLCIS